MIPRLGLALSRVFRRIVPDPFVIAVLLTALTAVLAVVFGRFDAAGAGPRVLSLLDAWRGADGLWRFLAFAMQMCLILVTGYCLAASRPVRRLLDGLAQLPRSTGQAAALVGLLAAAAGVVNWGLGLITGAILAREVGRSLRARGVRAHYPLICAAGYMGLLVWHGGLSGSAPLKSSTPQELADLFGAERLAALGVEAGVPLGRTLGSPLNLVVTGVLVLAVPALLAAMAPGRDADVRTIDEFDAPEAPQPPPPPAAGAADRLHDARLPAWLLAVPLLLAVARQVQVAGLGRFGPNEVNAAMLGLGLLLHGSLRSYATAAAGGARACAGIILQFPLYAGIMGMLAASGLAAALARWFAAAGDADTIPLLTFLSAGVVNLFVPSGGGQWGIQGLVALEAAQEAGVEPARMIMAVAYGDQLTNMLQPFWALPLLGITGVRARDIVGYTLLVMIVAGLWMAAGLLLW